MEGQQNGGDLFFIEGLAKKVSNLIFEERSKVYSGFYCDDDMFKLERVEFAYVQNRVQYLIADAVNHNMGYDCLRISYNSNDYAMSGTFGVRPVITLKDNVRITKSSTGDYWQLD